MTKVSDIWYYRGQKFADISEIPESDLLAQRTIKGKLDEQLLSNPQRLYLSKKEVDYYRDYFYTDFIKAHYKNRNISMVHPYYKGIKIYISTAKGKV